MKLDGIRAKNFRSLDDTEIVVRNNLTVLVGANNSGKSNVIDAIRLLTTPLGGRREIYASPTDVRFGSAESGFELEAVYSDLSAAQQGRFLSAATDPSLETATFGLTYESQPTVARRSPTIWCGSNRGSPEPGLTGMIRHVYLPPLRDAKRDLSSGNPTRIYSLLRLFLGEEDPDEVAMRLQRTSDDPILQRIDTAVGGRLSALTEGVRLQNASLGFASNERLIDIARDLRFKLADDGIEPEDLLYSGHGIANLLYISTIAVELERVADVDLTLFLVEEPEAHLHPQLQAAVLGFLEDRTNRSPSGGGQPQDPGGDLQIVVATHSPNLSAWAGVAKAIFVKSVHPAGNDADKDPQTPLSSKRPATRCVPISALGISNADFNKIDRYLDVTRSALLYGGRVLLVEGLAEALLLPVFAERIVFKDDQRSLRLFRSAVFVPIDGVDFAPYVKLLLTPYNDTRIADRVVVVTDGDAHDGDQQLPSAGDRRKTELETMARDYGAIEELTVAVSRYTLEPELVLAGNAQLLRSVYTQLHPLSQDKFDGAVELDAPEMAAAFKGLFESTRKGDFAQILANRIAGGDEFHVPEYIHAAIRAVVG